MFIIEVQIKEREKGIQIKIIYAVHPLEPLGL